MTILAAAPAAPARAAWLAAINAPGLSVVDVQWTTEVVPAAAHKRAGVTLSKITSAKAMVGAEYRALAENNARETGDLPWGTWVEGLYPYVIEHKGREYARINTVDGTLRSTYLVNGTPVSRDEFASFLTPRRSRGDGQASSRRDADHQDREPARHVSA